MRRLKQRRDSKASAGRERNMASDWTGTRIKVPVFRENEITAQCQEGFYPKSPYSPWSCANRFTCMT